MIISKFPTAITPELAEETGWHIGDGSMNFYKNKKHSGGLYQLRGHIEEDKQHYLNRIAPIFKKLYGIDINLREMPSTRVFGFQIWNKELVKFKQNLGLKTGPKLNLIIPLNFLKTDKLKAAVLRGIFDTDGCIYLEKKNHKLYPRVQISTICEDLGKQMSSVFKELGLKATINKKGSILRGNRKPDYILVIRGNEMFNKFMKVIKPQNPKHIAKYSFYQKSFK